MNDAEIKEYDKKGLVVYYKGTPALILSPVLANGKTPAQMARIRNLHIERLTWEERMETATSEIYLRVLLSIWHDIQFDLQEAWGFEKNINYHRFWDIGACACPVWDNNDAYPTGYYVKSGGCKLHGSEVPKNIIAKTIQGEIRKQQRPGGLLFSRGLDSAYDR